MKSSIAAEALQSASAPGRDHRCTAINWHVPEGLAICSLSSAPHTTHQLRCEDTGELLGEWTDADKRFREPSYEPGRRIEFREPEDDPSDALVAQFSHVA